MLLISNHILQCGQIALTRDVVIRINLAWIASLEDLDTLLSTISHDVFLDYPIGRTKPPTSSYTIDELEAVLSRHSNVRYLGISNIESNDDVLPFQHLAVKLVPKIETIKGVENIVSILSCLGGSNIIMIDHDDLCADIVRQGKDPGEMYTHYINPLLFICKMNMCQALRTQGVVFSTDY